ncbi:MAG: triose-phosphate isomerase [Nanoarchaeota archaeon]|nr:triose-phosphate isomerase [Nanoarchaeota archaeon]
MILINTKNYTAGKKTLALAKKIQKHIPQAIISVPAVDIELLNSKTKLNIYAQHLDSEKGRATGFLLPETARLIGAKGTLLNHSEHPLPLKKIKEIISRTKKSKLKIVLCASTLEKVKSFIPLKPGAIAFEDKNLIGTGKSITKYQSKKVEDFAKLLKKTKIIPLCGAGINSTEDIVAARKLGCKGVLIASAIAKPSNSKSADKFLKEISKIPPHFL